MKPGCLHAPQLWWSCGENWSGKENEQKLVSSTKQRFFFFFFFWRLSVVLKPLPREGKGRSGMCYSALPHARAEPRRGHGEGSWSRPLAVPPHTGTPDRSWQDFLAEMGWAQTLPHKWQIKSGSECEKWVTAAERRTSPAQRQRAAKDGGATGGTPRPSLVVLLCKFGSARQPVSPAAGSCPRWISLNAPCPACAYYFSCHPAEDALLLTRPCRASHPGPASTPPIPPSLTGDLLLPTDPSSVPHPQSGTEWGILGQGTHGQLACPPPPLPCTFTKPKDGATLRRLEAFLSINRFPQKSSSPCMPGDPRERAHVHLHAGTCARRTRALQARSAICNILSWTLHSPSPPLSYRYHYCTKNLDFLNSA